MQVQVDRTHLQPSHFSAAAQPRPLIRVKDIAWLVHLYPARWLAQVLPLRWLYALGDAAAVCGSACLRQPRKALVERLAVAFNADIDDPRLDAIATRFFQNAILRALDDLLMERLLRQPRLPDVEIAHLENLEQALSAGRGALLVSGHFYAGRLATRYLAKIGFPSLTVRNQQVADLRAGRLGTRLLLKRYLAFVGQALGEEVDALDPDCSLKMLARLRSGGLVCCYADTVSSRELVKLTFLGQERDFAAGYLYVTQFAGCPLVPMHCLGNSRRLRIEFGEAFWVEKAPDRRSLAEINVRKVHRILEAQISSHPAEWDSWIRW